MHPIHSIEITLTQLELALEAIKAAREKEVGKSYEKYRLLVELQENVWSQTENIKQSILPDPEKGE